MHDPKDPPRSDEEQRFLDFAQAASDWMWETDAGHRVIYFSENYKVFSGFAREDVFGLVPWEEGDIQDPKLRAANRAFEDALRAQKPFRDLPGFAHIVDGFLPVKRSGVPHFDKAGNFQGFRGVTSDVRAEFAALEERERAEMSRAASEERFRDFARISSDYLIETNANDDIIYVSSNHQETTGYINKAVLGYKPWTTPISDHPAVRETNRPVYQAIQAREDFRNIYCKTRNNKGDLVDVMRSGHARFDPEGVYLGHRIVTSFVTAEMQQRRERLLAEERFRDFATISSDYMTESDADHRIVFVSGRHEEKTGFDPSSVIGIRLWEHPNVALPEIQELHRPLFDQIKAQKSFKGYYTQIVSASGEFMDVIRNGLARFDEDGNFLGHRIVTTICTAEMQERRERLAAEQRFRDFAAASSDWFWESDADDTLSYIGEIDSVPGTFHAKTGVDVYDLVAEEPEMEPGCNEPFRRMFRAREAFRGLRGQMRTPNGPVPVIRSGVPRFADDGTFLGYRGSATDISKLVAAENEQRRLTERLAHSERLKAIGQLTGGVAHDFNNLLAVIQGNIELAQLEPRSEHVPEYLELAATSAARGASLTRSLLAYSRQQPLSPQSIDVGEMLMRLSKTLAGPLGKSVVLSTELARGLWPCFADQSLLETALINLVINSRDAMTNGGRVTLKAENERVDQTGSDDLQAGDYVTISVTDDGIGMDMETRERAFEPFFTTKGMGEGSGLGLSMAYGFAKQSNGHIQIISEPGNGCCVTLQLPRYQGVQAVPMTKSELPNLSGTRVLVVEDNEGVLKILSGFLKSLDCEFSQATGVEGATAIFDTGARFDVLILDIMLPGKLSGVDLSELLAAKYGRTKTLFVSGYTDGENKQIPGLGASGELLLKPFSRKQLAEALDRVLHSSAVS